eukprot:tig00000254_g22577.t1
MIRVDVERARPASSGVGVPAYDRDWQEHSRIMKTEGEAPAAFPAAAAVSPAPAPAWPTPAAAVRAGGLQSRSLKLQKGGIIEQKYADRLRAIDTDGDGCVDEAELLSLIDRLVEEERSIFALKKERKKLLIAFGIALALVFVLLAANFGLTFAVLELSKDTKSVNGALTDKATGATLRTAPATLNVSFTRVSENPVLRRRLRSGTLPHGVVGTVPMATIRTACAFVNAEGFTTIETRMRVGGNLVSGTVAVRFAGASCSDPSAPVFGIFELSGTGYHVEGPAGAADAFIIDAALAQAQRNAEANGTAVADVHRGLRRLLGVGDQEEDGGYAPEEDPEGLARLHRLILERGFYARSHSDLVEIDRYEGLYSTLAPAPRPQRRLLSHGAPYSPSATEISGWNGYSIPYEPVAPNYDANSCYSQDYWWWFIKRTEHVCEMTFACSTHGGFKACHAVLGHPDRKWANLGYQGWSCPSSPPDTRQCIATKCFPGNALVMVEGVGARRISSLGPDDRVLVRRPDGSRAYEPVYLWGHRDPEARSPFVALRTAATGRLLRLSAEHYVPVSRGGAPEVLVKASAVRPGDAVHVFTGAGAGEGSDVGGEFARDVVASVSVEEDVGLYNPYTASGTIVVDGVVASVHSAFLLDLPDSSCLAPHLPTLYQALLLPARLAHAVLPKALWEPLQDTLAAPFVAPAAAGSARAAIASAWDTLVGALANGYCALAGAGRPQGLEKASGTDVDNCNLFHAHVNVAAAPVRGAAASAFYSYS